MSALLSPVPQICISLASPEKPQVEPKSPFSPVVAEDVDGFRASYLSPPLMGSPRSATGGRLSPLRPADSPVVGKGLERERFEALLKASKERNAAMGGKRAVDLRKEIALKAHKTKQVERRALFLSKIFAPPSPTATHTAKTPPESPAIFHYSLPSPGLVSPLALFESLASEDPTKISPREPWVEQVDFRLPEGMQRKVAPNAAALRSADKPRKALPSLAEISARLSAHGQVPTPRARAEDQPSPRRLPAFLASRMQPQPQPSPVAAPAPAPEVEPKAQPALKRVGRLQLPIRSQKVTSEPAAAAPSLSPVAPVLQVTASVGPAVVSTEKLTESNLQAFNSRTRRSEKMLSAIRRRTVNFSALDIGLNLEEEQEKEDRKSRRISAPAELPPCARAGFQHPVLAMPGGF